MNVSLVVFTPNGSTKTINLRSGRYVIGRKDTASLRIALPQVSREHCELVVEGEQLKFRDLKSSNGTFKNNKRTETGTLDAGDFLSVGPIQMGVQFNGKPEKLLPPAPEKPAAIDAALAETPPAGVPSPAASSASKTRAPAGPAGDDPDRTVTSNSGASPVKKSLSADDSSVFDFDFDFENDEKPKR